MNKLQISLMNQNEYYTFDYDIKYLQNVLFVLMYLNHKDF